MKLEQIKREREKPKKYNNEMPASSGAIREYHPMGEGDRRRKTRNRNSSRYVTTADDQTVADDATEMASLTIMHTSGDKGNHGSADNSRGTIDGSQQSEVYDQCDVSDDLIRDNIRLSYRLSKGNLHPHFDSPTESFRMARKYSSTSKLPYENDEDIDKVITAHDGTGSSPVLRRRRKSMTLALEEGELDISGHFDRQSSPYEQGIRSPTSPGDDVFSTGTSPPRISESNLQQQVSFQLLENNTTEVINSKDLRKKSKPNSKDKHRTSLTELRTFKDSAQSSRRSSSEKESKLRPKDFMAKLKLNFSRKSKQSKQNKQKDKKSPVISSPIPRVMVDSGSINQSTESIPSEQNVQLRAKTGASRDPANRLTWHGTTDIDGTGRRSRRLGVSPVDNARYSIDMQQELLTSKSTTNVAEYGRLRPIADFYEEVSVTQTKKICFRNINS